MLEKALKQSQEVTAVIAVLLEESKKVGNTDMIGATMEWHETAEAGGFQPGVRNILEELREVALECSPVAVIALLDEVNRLSDILVKDVHEKTPGEGNGNIIKELCDVIVTVGGLASRLGFKFSDLQPIYKLTTISNFSKFLPIPNGINMFDQQKANEFAEKMGYSWKSVGNYIVFYDENGKIRKGPHYVSVNELKDNNK